MKRCSCFYGDIHGQLSDAISIFDQNGHPPEGRYLYLGDYVDRGDYSIETACLLFGLKLLHPNCIFLLRGNHETRIINKVYGFYDECVSPTTKKNDGSLYLQSCISTPIMNPKPVTSMEVTTDPEIKMKTKIEEIVKRLMKFPTEPSKSALTYDEIIEIVVRTREVLMLDSAMIEIEPPVTVVGDIHGQFSDAISIFDQNGHPPEGRYLYLGDYVDRGDYSIETACLLFGLKLLHPNCIFLLRGNHETRIINKVYGFYDECVKRFKA